MDIESVKRVADFHKTILKRICFTLGGTLSFQEQYRCPVHESVIEQIDYFVKVYDRTALIEDNRDPYSIKCYPLTCSVFCCGSKIKLGLREDSLESARMIAREEADKHRNWNVDADRMIYVEDGVLVYDVSYDWVNYYD